MWDGIPCLKDLGYKNKCNSDKINLSLFFMIIDFRKVDERCRMSFPYFPRFRSRKFDQ